MSVDVARREPAAWPAVTWAVAGFALYLIGGLGMLFVSLTAAELVLASMGIESGSGTVGLSIRNAAHPIGWGASVAAASMLIGPRLVPGVRFGAAGWIVLATGLALAAITTFLDIEFVRASHGVYDFEYGGLTGFAGPALVAMALAAWAGLAVPPGQPRILDALTIVAAAGLIALLLPSTGGAADGIDTENIPLAVTFIADATYALIVAALMIRPRPTQGA